MNSWEGLLVTRESKKVKTPTASLQQGTCSRQNCTAPKAKMNSKYFRSECLEHYRESQKLIMRIRATKEEA